MIDSRSIDDLHPFVAALCYEFMARCKQAGVSVTVYSTYRDHEKQAALYEQGRTTSGKRVTNSKPGFSYHNFRLAFDFVPLKNGVAAWDDDNLWEVCGEIAESIGLEWGGRWTKFPDKPHCQYTGGLSLADLRAGKTVPVG